MITDISDFLREIESIRIRYVNGEVQNLETVMDIYKNIGAAIGWLAAADAINVVAFGEGVYKETIDALEKSEAVMLGVAAECAQALVLKDLPQEYIIEMKRKLNANYN